MMIGRALAFQLLATLLSLVPAGCKQAPSHPVTADRKEPAASTAQPPPPASKGLASAPLVAIGDLHGDLGATRKALRLAGAIDLSDHWIGGTRVVVQTGDVLDRGDDERQIMELFERLRGEAKQAGGAFIPLSGNHEVMNVAQDFRYVTPAGMQSFASEGGRDHAFRPGGRYAKVLSEWPIIARVGDTVFVHGGVLEKHARYGVERINREVAAWMRGEAQLPPEIVVSEDGPIWTRLYSTEPGEAACAELGRALVALGAKRMVVGHTPQPRGISAACEGRVFRIDVGMARAYGGQVQVLSLAQDTPKVLGPEE